MILFDDESRNIDDIGALCVHAVLVDHETGATITTVKEALANFAQLADRDKSTTTTDAKD